MNIFFSFFFHYERASKIPPRGKIFFFLLTQKENENFFLLDTVASEQQINRRALMEI